jgi:hypothetical protein
LEEKKPDEAIHETKDSADESSSDSSSSTEDDALGKLLHPSTSNGKPKHNIIQEVKEPNI